MKSKSIYFAILLSFLAGCISVKYQAQSAKIGTKAVLDKQVVSWNKGDMPAYMEGYWKNDSLQFIGKSGVTYGWDKTLANYQRTYPDAAAMGELEFSDLHVNDINPTLAYVTGKWKLKRAAGDQEGHFSLLFRKIDTEWKIVADHSS
jgi:ketosteroid isomerase-like protein